jgi:hypothetical protein
MKLMRPAPFPNGPMPRSYGRSQIAQAKKYFDEFDNRWPPPSGLREKYGNRISPDPLYILDSLHAYGAFGVMDHSHDLLTRFDRIVIPTWLTAYRPQGTKKHLL